MIAFAHATAKIVLGELAETFDDTSAEQWLKWEVADMCRRYAAALRESR